MLRSRWFAVATLLAFGVSCQDGPAPTGVAPRDAAPRLAEASPGDYVHFYVHGHQDDWQLFMGDRAYNSLQVATKVVFVYTTAGDANQGTAYYTTRETAALASQDTLLGGPMGGWSCATQAIAAHPLRRCAKGKAVAYFMRLPDGGTSGEGFGGRGALAMLRDGNQATLTAIDNSTSYVGWNDFVGTLRALVDHEGGNQSAPFVEVNAPEWNRTTNPGDHADHYATADATQLAASTRGWNINWYIDYQTRNMTANLTTAVRDIKVKAFYAYDYRMGSAGYGGSRFEPEYQAWLGRTYYRSEISTPVPPPATPTGLSGTASSSTAISLSWTDNATNETAYLVQRAPDVSGAAGTFAQVASLGADAASYSDAGLSAATTYWYRVRAQNASDSSSWSTPASVTTLALPIAPSDLSATAISATRIDLAWTDNSSDETGFVLERAPDVAGAPGAYAQVATVPANNTTYSNSGLTGGTRYWYRVRATRTPDASAYSLAASAQTPVAPAAPSALAVSVISASQLDLAWTDNAGNETAYAVERAPDVAGQAGTFAQIVALGADATSYSDAGLASGTRYWYRVRAVNGADSSAYSGSASGTTLPLVPNAPSNLQATAFSSARIDLAWSDNATNETSFLVERAPDVGGNPGTFAQVASLGANAVSYSATGLAPTTRYWFRVRATNAGGNSAYSASASATTLEAPTTRTDFYVHAHQDDWQLFMGDRAYNSLQVASKVVFVYTTAGDANQGTAYYTTRETAALASQDTLLGGPMGGWSCGAQVVNAHSLRRCVKGKAVAYFLRLPDGGTTGNGWGGRGSLARLRDGSIASLTAMDGSTVYTGWNDVVTTMRALADLESGNASTPGIEMNAPDWNRTLNPKDHADHWATADLVRAASQTRSWTINWYIDYHTKNLAANISTALRDIKVKAFYAYDYRMGAAGYGGSRFESDYQAWLGRTYYRTEIMP